MSKYPSYKALLSHYNSKPNNIKLYFKDLTFLIDPKSQLDWEVVIAYLFIKVETAQNRALYGGAVKLHRAHPDVTQSMLYNLHVTRDCFLILFKNVFGKPLNSDVLALIKSAMKVRDKSVHGKQINEAEARNATGDVLDYALGFNEQLYKLGGFYPFGDMRGFKGNAKPLEKNTSHWLLKGIGF